MFLTLKLWVYIFSDIYICFKVHLWHYKALSFRDAKIQIWKKNIFG